MELDRDSRRESVSNNNHNGDSGLVLASDKTASVLPSGSQTEKSEQVQPCSNTTRKDLFRYWSPSCYVCKGSYGSCFNDPTCATCHEFLYPNVAPDSSILVTNYDSDDSDSGNDEPKPADNSLGPNGCNSSNEEHTLPQNKVEDDLDKNLKSLSIVDHRVTVNINDLPPEVLSQILKYLDDISLWCFSQVCRFFEGIVLMQFPPCTWKRFVCTRWPLLFLEDKERDWYHLYSSLMRGVFCLKCVKQMAAQESPARDENSWRKNCLKSEQTRLRLNPLDGINTLPLDSMSCHWIASIQGPVGSPYEGGLFFLYIQIPYSYPMVSPVVRFLTKILHLNISRHGDIGIDSIHRTWSKAVNISKILSSIQSLLADPIRDIRMEPETAKLYEKDQAAFEEQARRWTWEYAMHHLRPT